MCLKDNLFGVEDGAVFAAEFVFIAFVPYGDSARGYTPYGDSAPCSSYAPYGDSARGYTFDGAGLAEAYAAGHHLFHTYLAVDFFIAGELGDSCKHRAGAAGVDNRFSRI